MSTATVDNFVGIKGIYCDMSATARDIKKSRDILNTRAKDMVKELSELKEQIKLLDLDYKMVMKEIKEKVRPVSRLRKPRIGPSVKKEHIPEGFYRISTWDVSTKTMAHELIKRS